MSLKQLIKSIHSDLEKFELRKSDFGSVVLKGKEERFGYEENDGRNEKGF